MQRVESKKKVSMYTIFIPKEDGTYIVTNTLSGAIVHIDDKIYIEELSKIMQNCDELIYNKNNNMHKHFYDSGLFVDDDVDEYSMVLYHHERGVVRDNGLRLTLLTTRQCNFRCSYCYEDFRDDFMTDETYENILKYLEKSLKDKLHKSVTISLFGGEPFLEFNKVLNFLKQAKYVCEKYGIPFTSNATTNFALLTKERFMALAEVNCNFYQVTVDGFAKTHDIRRMYRCGSGSFDRIIKNLLDAKQCDYDFKIAIRTNFDGDVANDIEEFYCYLKENFDDSRFSIIPYPVSKMGGKNDDALDVLTRDQSIEVLSVANQIAVKLGINNTIHETYSSPFSGVCYASKHNNHVVDCDGTIMKCTLVLDDDFNKVGCLKNDGNIDIDHKKHCKWTNRDSMLGSKCKSCDILPVCFGKGCPLHVIKGEEHSCDRELLRYNFINRIKSLVI